jgi:hypothetical protein
MLSTTVSSNACAFSVCMDKTYKSFANIFIMLLKTVSVLFLFVVDAFVLGRFVL